MCDKRDTRAASVLKVCEGGNGSFARGRFSVAQAFASASGERPWDEAVSCSTLLFPWRHQTAHWATGTFTANGCAREKVWTLGGAEVLLRKATEVQSSFEL